MPIRWNGRRVDRAHPFGQDIWIEDGPRLHAEKIGGEAGGWPNFLSCVLSDGADGIKGREIVPERTLRQGLDSANLVPEFFAAGKRAGQFPAVLARLDVVLDDLFVFRFPVETNTVSPAHILFREHRSFIFPPQSPKHAAQS